MLNNFPFIYNTLLEGIRSAPPEQTWLMRQMWAPHGVGAAAPEALRRIRVRSRILGALRRVERGAGKWAGGGAGRRGGAWSSRGGEGRGGDYGVGESNIMYKIINNKKCKNY